MSELTCLEICAGAGGQSRGLELAGFGHALVLEIDSDAAETLRVNRRDWNVVEDDVPEPGRRCTVPRRRSLGGWGAVPAVLRSGWSARWCR